jgi:hypothetical protein
LRRRGGHARGVTTPVLKALRPPTICGWAARWPSVGSDLSKRTLTYVISIASFPSETDYRSVVDFMASATTDWEEACPECQIDFQHLDKLDAAADPGDANFVVRHRDTGGAFIARAFFSHHQGDRREVVIDPSFFQTNFDKTGVLLHELGHVLGYRHEHTRGVVGCRFEDGNWVPLTEYDPVMHYFCGGGGSFNLELTQVDKEGQSPIHGHVGRGDGCNGVGDGAGTHGRASAEPWRAAMKRMSLIFTFGVVCIGVMNDAAAQSEFEGPSVVLEFEGDQAAVSIAKVVVVLPAPIKPDTWRWMIGLG